MKNAIFYTLMIAAVPGPVLSADQCSMVFGGPSPAVMERGYLDVMLKWRPNWDAETRASLERLARPGEALEKDIAEFRKQREFRTWFERRNRMSFEDLERNQNAVAQVKYLPDNQTAFQAKILAIRAAKHTIDVTYFQFEGDSAGLALLGELQAAVRRGVSVRIMNDPIGSAHNSPQAYLKALVDDAAKNAGFMLNPDGTVSSHRATVEIVNFNPLFAAPRNMLRELARSLFGWATGHDPSHLGRSINRRSHDKILLIDGAFQDKAVAFMGGRNVTEGYYDIGADHIEDAEVVMKGVAFGSVEGPTIGRQVQEYFDQIYFHLDNAQVTRSILGRVFGHEKQQAAIEEARARVSAQFKLDENSAELVNTLLEEGFTLEQVEVANTFHNIFRDQAARRVEIREHKLEIANSRSLMNALTEAIKKETKEIVIVSPYMWMSRRQTLLMKAWLRADPSRKLTIVTNSLMTTDNALTSILVDGTLGPALMNDPGVVAADGTVIRRSVSNQVKIYVYGRADSRIFGGKVNDGMLHMKGMVLVGSDTTMIGTFNNDPRSLLLNSEGAAVIKGEATAKQVLAHIGKIIDRSHLWGSPEYHALREHEALPAKTRRFAKQMAFYQSLLHRLNLWWML